MSAGPNPHGPMPPIEPGHPISDYTQDQLVALATWIQSDTLLRTEDELVEALMYELGFKRRGKRIEERLRTTVAGTPGATSASRKRR